MNQIIAIFGCVPVFLAGSANLPRLQTFILGVQLMALVNTLAEFIK